MVKSSHGGRGRRLRAGLGLMMSSHWLSASGDGLVSGVMGVKSGDVGLESCNRSGVVFGVDGAVVASYWLTDDVPDVLRTWYADSGVENAVRDTCDGIIGTSVSMVAAADFTSGGYSTDVGS